MVSDALCPNPKPDVGRGGPRKDVERSFSIHVHHSAALPTSTPRSLQSTSSSIRLPGCPYSRIRINIPATPPVLQSADLDAQPPISLDGVLSAVFVSQNHRAAFIKRGIPFYAILYLLVL